jgi:FixJ family two-component response regulator
MSVADGSLVSIVDDDVPFCRALSRFVEALGLPVAPFHSAEAFLRSEALATTACLILDVWMPGMTGIELQGRLLAEGHHLPVIFIAGDADAAVREEAFAAGAIAFLSKPFDAGTLISCIRRAIGDHAVPQPNPGRPLEASHPGR